MVSPLGVSLTGLTTGSRPFRRSGRQAQSRGILRRRPRQSFGGLPAVSPLDVRRQPAAELLERPGARLRAGQEHVVAGALDADVGEVAPQRPQPAPDLVDV